MKKFVFFIASVVVAGLLMSACGNTKECPAYSQNSTSVVSDVA